MPLFAAAVVAPKIAAVAAAPKALLRRLLENANPLDIPEGDPTHAVWVPTYGKHIPPKCAPLIREILSEAGLETAPIDYYPAS